MSRPLVIAGHASGVGKTTVATGLMGALREKGLTVAPFKVGPDYIDPSYHEKAAGMPSRNLDTWLTSPESVRAIYARGAEGADIGVVEGVMGLFDGRAGAGDEGSTAEVARLLDGAVVLVVDCARMARSLAPLLAGFDGFDERTVLCGTILNNVGSVSHARMLRDAAREAGVPVLGEIPRREGMSLKSRHLGLVPAAEHDESEEILKEAIAQVGKNVDLDALLTVVEAGADRGRHGAHDPDGGPAPARRGSAPDRVGKAHDFVRIAVARDEAFFFYYVDSLEVLEEAGAELVYFSPLRDNELPACDGLYLGGGFPEIFAAGLEANSSMRGSVAAAVRGGLPTYAECGGLVYLCRGVEAGGRRHEMAGAIESEARMTSRRQALGYVEARARQSSVLLRAGERIRGHEFHWSRVAWQEERLAYDCFSTRKPQVEEEGYCHGPLLASYVHMHFAGNPQAAARFIEVCERTGGVGAGAAS